MNTQVQLSNVKRAIRELFDTAEDELRCSPCKVQLSAYLYNSICAELEAEL